MSLTQLLEPRICELGKIKIGGLATEAKQKSSGTGTWRPPVKYDHFVVTTLQRDEHGHLIPDGPLMESLQAHADRDGKLRQLPIALLSNDLDDVLQASYFWFNGKKLAGKFDGTTCTIYFDSQRNQWLDAPQIADWEPRFAEPDDKGNPPLFKLHCTLNAVVVSALSRWGGVYKFRTTSQISSDQLLGSLVHLKQLTGGILRGVPLQLVVRPVVVNPKSKQFPNGKTTTVYVVHVEMRGTDLIAIQRQALDVARNELTAAKEIAAYRKMLAAPEQFLDEDDASEVVEEFHPPQPALTAPPDPKPGPETPSVEDHRRALRAAATVDELRRAWDAIDQAAYTAAELADLASVKSDRKIMLTEAPATAAAAPEDNPADHVPPEPEPERERQPGEDEPDNEPDVPPSEPATAPSASRLPDAVVQAVLAACHAKKLTFTEAVAKHGTDCGIPIRPNLHVADLTLVQADKLVAAVGTKSKKAAGAAA